MVTSALLHVGIRFRNNQSVNQAIYKDIFDLACKRKLIADSSEGIFF